MLWSFASSRLALTLRRLRSRFGITAPKVAVHTHLPWHWRALAAVLLGALALVLAVWIYDAGRRFAGFNRSESEDEISTLREKVSRLEVEATDLRGTAAAGESNLQIERTTLEQLTTQVRALETENTRLKEELAVFENLAGGEAKSDGVTLSRLRVDPDTTAGRYRFSLLAALQGALRGHDFNGALQVAVTLQQGNDSAIVVLPRAGDPEAARYAVSFRNFRRLTGSFQVPAEAKVKSVEVRLVQDGAIRAAQKITL